MMLPLSYHLPAQIQGSEAPGVTRVTGESKSLIIEGNERKFELFLVRSGVLNRLTYIPKACDVATRLW